MSKKIKRTTAENHKTADSAATKEPMKAIPFAMVAYQPDAPGDQELIVGLTDQCKAALSGLSAGDGKIFASQMGLAVRERIEAHMALIGK